MDAEKLISNKKIYDHLAESGVIDKGISLTLFTKYMAILRREGAIKTKKTAIIDLLHKNKTKKEIIEKTGASETYINHISKITGLRKTRPKHRTSKINETLRINKHFYSTE